MKRINIVTLGCSKNIADSEHIAFQLAEGGYEVIFDSNDTDAGTVIVNTCGFIADAKEESIETILEFADAKNRGLIERLFVIGCLSQRYREELHKEIPEVDGYFGARDMSEVIRALDVEYRPEKWCERLQITPKHYAYLKISEGCNRNCSYCIIPHIRGSHKSLPVEELVREAEMLAFKGVKELIVIAQETTFYGMDLYGERRLGELLERLCQINGIEWIRLHYAYPANFPDDVIKILANEPKMCKYLDIPLQHISDNQLSLMRRNITREQTLDLIERLRREVPCIAIRTTMLVGHPGETEKDFEELKQFVADIEFERLGVFIYSPEEGTYSADRMEDDVPEMVRHEREKELMLIQRGISSRRNLSLTGTVQRVIIDCREGSYYLGRTQYDSPEVDNQVYISSPKRLQKGSFYDVRITSADDYDLYAVLN